jgi:hypothetical protein
MNAKRPDSTNPDQQTQSFNRDPVRVRLVRDEWPSDAERKTLDDEVVAAIARETKSKAETDRLADADYNVAIRLLIHRHCIQKAMGIPSDYVRTLENATDRLDEKFFNALARAIKEIGAADDSQHVIVRTLLESYRRLRQIRYDEWSRTNPKPSPIPQELRRSKFPVPTKAEVRRESVKSILAINRDWEVPQTKDWARYFKLANLSRLPNGTGGRPRKNLRKRSGKGRKHSTKKDFAL